MLQPENGTKKYDALFSEIDTGRIDDLEEYGVWVDDYYRFIEKRGERVLAELKKRLEPEL